MNMKCLVLHFSPSLSSLCRCSDYRHKASMSFYLYVATVNRVRFVFAQRKLPALHDWVCQWFALCIYELFFPYLLVILNGKRYLRLCRLCVSLLLEWKLICFLLRSIIWISLWYREKLNWLLSLVICDKQITA